MSIWFIVVYIFTICNVSRFSEALFCLRYQENVDISFEEFSYERLEKSFTFNKISSKVCGVRIFVEYRTQTLEISFDMGHKMWVPEMTTLECEQLISGYKTVTLVSVYYVTNI
jgi:hypothetical protein